MFRQRVSDPQVKIPQCPLALRGEHTRPARAERVAASAHASALYIMRSRTGQEGRRRRSERGNGRNATKCAGWEQSVSTEQQSVSQPVTVGPRGLTAACKCTIVACLVVWRRVVSCRAVQVHTTHLTHVLVTSTAVDSGNARVPVSVQVSDVQADFEPEHGGAQPLHAGTRHHSQAVPLLVRRRRPPEPRGQVIVAGLRSRQLVDSLRYAVRLNAR